MKLNRPSLKKTSFYCHFQDCQRSCSKNDLCEFWTFHQSEQVCHMRSGEGDSGRAHQAGAVSGLKQCPGKHPKVLKIKFHQLNDVQSSSSSE